MSKQSTLLTCLLKTLRAETKERLSKEQGNILLYTFKKIEPKDLDELAFVTANIGLQKELVHEIISDYISERNKDTSVFLPYNKIRNAQETLKKSWGILIYREQVEKILEEITGRRYGDLPATIFLDIDVLIECLKKDYRERLTEREIERIDRDLRRFTKIFMNYGWCHEIAEKALQLAEEEKDKKVKSMRKG